MQHFIPLSESNCADSNKPHFFVFVDEYQKQHIGIGVATQYFGGSIEVEIFHSTSKYSNGQPEDIPQENIKLVSREPFLFDALDHSTFNALDSKNPPPKGLYYVLSPTFEVDYDTNADGHLVAGNASEVDLAVSFGFLSRSREPEEFPIDFDSVEELSRLDDSESHFITHYLAFEWPTLS